MSTEIPGGFPKKVCPETFVSNHTGPIRIAEDQMQRLIKTSDKYLTAGPPNEFKSLNELKADVAREIYERAEAALEDRIVSIISRSTFRLSEDQMQRLMRCILAAGWLVRNDGSQSFQANWRSAEAMLSYEPKPEPAPGQVKVSGGGWVDPEPAPGHVSAQIWSDLWRDYNEGKEELLKAKQEIERRTEERDIARDHAFDLFNQLNKAEQEIERLKICADDSDNNATYWRQQVEGVTEGEERAYDYLQSEIERLRTELSKCAWHGAFEDTKRIMISSGRKSRGSRRRFRRSGLV